MAIVALHSAASGMKALDQKLDVTANNLANVNTTGFKKSRVNFEDLLYDTKREPGIPNAEDEPTPYGIQIGLGVQTSGTQLDFTPGPIDPTDKELDWRINGPGFFQVRSIFNGTPIVAYTRAGNFIQNPDGTIVLGNSLGTPLEPPITLPADTTQVAVSASGEVRVRQTGSETLNTVGQIQLARFVNPEGLLQIGNTLYAETDASGPPFVGDPQTDGMGAVYQGQLELSNVEPVRELVSLITTQRSFELNSQSIQAADQALQVVTNLRRF